MIFIDFNKEMSNFAKSWYAKNAAKFSEEELQQKAYEAIEEWKNLPMKELTGKTPFEFFTELSDSEIMEFLVSAVQNECVPDLLLQELSKRRTLEESMSLIVQKCVPGELTEILMHALQDMESKLVIPIYAEWLFDTKLDESLAKLAGEYLCEIIDKPTYDMIDKKLVKMPKKLKPRLSDFIVYMPPTANGYNLLLDLFLSGEDMPLYASYLGMYGNPEAIPHLLTAAEDCNYVSFIEIVNAVERLGGEVKIKRDFEDDADYIKIKQNN